MRIRRKEDSALCDSQLGCPSDSSMVHAYLKSRDISTCNDSTYRSLSCALLRHCELQVHSKYRTLSFSLPALLGRITGQKAGDALSPRYTPPPKIPPPPFYIKGWVRYEFCSKTECACLHAPAAGADANLTTRHKRLATPASAHKIGGPSSDHLH